MTAQGAALGTLFNMRRPERVARVPALKLCLQRIAGTAHRLFTAYYRLLANQ
jgi:hypothetical protein